MDANALPALPLCPPDQRYTYHLLDKSAPFAGRFGRYRRLAVVRVDHHERLEGYVPPTIRDTRGVNVLKTWDDLSWGKTARSEYGAALLDAQVFLGEVSAA